MKQNHGIHPSRISKFINPALAKSFSERTEKASMIVMGDDGKYWVCFMADASRLIKAGFELMPR